MTDRDSTNVDAAAYHARQATPGDRDDQPTRGELANDNPWRIDSYKGICGGCNQPVSANSSEPGGHEGSCYWTGGPWHPSCRAADPEWQRLHGRDKPTTGERRAA